RAHFALDMPVERASLFPYTTLFRSLPGREVDRYVVAREPAVDGGPRGGRQRCPRVRGRPGLRPAEVGIDVVGCQRRRRRREEPRSEEHTSELQSRVDLVCRLLLVQK